MGVAAKPAEDFQSLFARWADVRERGDRLFDVVRPEALYDRPIAERHRIIFYLGHLEAFDWNLLGRRTLDIPSFHESFDHLFAFGIDPVGGGLPTDQPSDWPHAPEITEYNRRIRETLDSRIRTAIATGADVPLLGHGLGLHVAIEHRLMHLETLAYMFHQLPADRKVTQPQAAAPPAQSPVPRMVEIPAGTATLGRPRSLHGDFGWDNEFEQLQVHVPAFHIDAHKVTNREFLEFIAAGGYQEPNLWTAADWEWRTSQGVSHPLFWNKQNGEWRQRNMFEEVPLEPDWPVYVSHAEASAYARWKGKRLPMEAQWHRAAYGSPGGRENSYPWGEQPPASAFGNFDFHRWDPVSVAAHPAGASAFGVADLVGNGWEWTSTRFGPLPGFEPFPFYPGYSADFFDGKHYVIKGGSARSASVLLRRTFRNWFQPHYPYVYAGFRCVEA